MAGVALLCLLSLQACYGLRRSSGGQQASFEPPRRVDAADVVVPAGYRIEAAATGLTFPTGVAFDRDGAVYVVESGYAYGETWTTPRLLRIGDDGVARVVASGGRNGPWNGVAFHDDSFFVAEGGELEGGRILRIYRNGETRVVAKGLPSFGDHHTNGPAVGDDGWLYFGQGTATNSGVVGEDNADYGWLRRKGDFHDVPCERVRLRGTNFTSANPLTSDRGDRAVTGAFLPFGTPSRAGQTIEGRVPCSGSVLRVRPDGGEIELVAWGFRNPFGLAFAPDGRLFVTDNGYDERGSRPVWGTGDLLWEVRPGRWYGWPEFSGAEPLEKPGYEPPGGSAIEPVLEAMPGTPPKPAAVLCVHASADGFDFSRSPRFGHVGEAFVALFGDMAPAAGKVLAPVGFKVVRVEPKTGTMQDFVVNEGDANGPATKIGGAGLERPVAARFDPTGEALYVVDFGVIVAAAGKPSHQAETGVLWRVTRELA